MVFVEESCWQVVVAGGGPCGLFAALGLARKGISVLVLEKGENVDTSPRATAYQPCAIAEMIELGIWDDVQAECIPDATISWWRARTDDTEHRHLATITTRDGLKGESENTLAGINLGQDELSRTVLKHLQGYTNATVRWRYNVVDATQTEDLVRITCQTVQTDGTPKIDHVLAKWLVGADGARSAVRKLMKVGFDGFTWPKEEFVASNIYYPCEDYGFTPRNFIIDGVNWAIVAKITRSGLWRVAFGAPDGKSEEEIRASLQEHYRYILPGPATGWKVTQVKKYKPHQRCVTSMRVGRMLLIGDAAHLNNPVGGLGLTTGLLDAGPLARALAAIILSGAPATILDTWSELRISTWWKATNVQSIEFKRIAQQGGYGNDPLGIWTQDETARKAGMLPYMQSATPEAKARDEALYVALSDKKTQESSRARVWNLALPADWMADHEDADLVKWRQSFRPSEN